MTEAGKAKLIALNDTYKEHICNKLKELLPERLERIARQFLQGLTSKQVISEIYLQGVSEALDCLSVQELLRAFEEPESEIQA